MNHRVIQLSAFVAIAFTFGLAPPTVIQAQEKAFVYDPAECPEAKPWTSENFKNNPDNFQFAILGDRGGGANPQGTYQRAIEQLNWLQPEFVMSVGDYVEGYTSDPKVMNEQWDEFDGIVKKLEMPFFYVRGNHDINTPITREAWAKRRGPKYYHFKYKDVLFIALDTEEPLQPVAPELEADLSRFNDLNINAPDKAKEFAAKVDLMSRVQEIVAGEPPEIDFQEHQIEWFKKVLAKNQDVRWTFVFLHQPVWNNPSESFKQIDNAIQGRKYTFFAGHTHYYDYDLLNDNEYITVASAGATFVHDGPGNVDHMTWVTMTENGPKIGNIALKGIFDRKGLDPKMFGAYDRSPHVGHGHGAGEESDESEPGKSLGIASVPNLRDLGGYQTKDGRTVKRGLVYRSNQLHHVSADDMEKLAQLGLKNSLDLRTWGERQPKPDEVPPEVAVIWLDVLAGATGAGPAENEKLMQNPLEANKIFGGGKADEGFEEAYRQFVSLPSARHEFRKLFLMLGDENELPALFHCTTGKDRTGWAAAALLTLLGVPKEVVMEDYLQSNEYIIPMYQEVIDKFVAGGGEKEIPLTLLGVKKAFLEASFDEMKKEYGTIEKYFSEGLSINEVQQQALRELYLGK